MFGFLKNKKIELYSPVTGQLIKITEVEDPVFSKKMMGDGFAIKPTEDDVYSPIKGKVVSVFPTKHAVSFITDDGVEGLVHMGLDTVELEGRPFTIYVEEGDVLEPATQIATVDLKQLENENKTSDIVVVFTNLDNVQKKVNLLSRSNVTQGDEVGELIK